MNSADKFAGGGVPGTSLMLFCFVILEESSYLIRYLHLVCISSSGDWNDGRQAAGEGQEMAAATDQKVNKFSINAKWI